MKINTNYKRLSFNNSITNIQSNVNVCTYEMYSEFVNDYNQTYAYILDRYAYTWDTIGYIQEETNEYIQLSYDTLADELHKYENSNDIALSYVNDKIAYVHDELSNINTDITVLSSKAGYEIVRTELRDFKENIVGHPFVEAVGDPTKPNYIPAKFATHLFADIENLQEDARNTDASLDAVNKFIGTAISNAAGLEESGHRYKDLQSILIDYSNNYEYLNSYMLNSYAYILNNIQDMAGIANYTYNLTELRSLYYSGYIAAEDIINNSTVPEFATSILVNNPITDLGVFDYSYVSYLAENNIVPRLNSLEEYDTILHTDIDNNTSAINTNKINIENITRIVSDNSSDIATHTDAINNITNNINTLATNHNSLLEKHSSEIQETINNITALTQNLQDLSDETNTAILDINGKITALENKEDKDTKYDTEIMQLNNAINKVTQSTKTVQDDIYARILKLSNNLAEKVAYLEGLYSETVEFNPEQIYDMMKDAQFRMMSFETEIKSLVAANKEANERIEALEACLANQASVADIEYEQASNNTITEPNILR